MSVQTEIDRLNAVKERIRTNLVAQGITVPEDTMLDAMAEQILSVAGQRGTGILKVTTATTSASGTGDNGEAIKYKLALSTVKSEANVSEVLVGDTVMRSYYTYPVVSVDDSYVYLGAYTSIRGATGAAGSAGEDGTSVTVASVTESTEDGGSNVVEFSDGKSLTVRNGKTGKYD